MENNHVKIGKRIRVAREKAGMTQEGLSIAVGCSPKHIGAIERGLKTPRVDSLIKIINTLHTTPDILLQDVIDFRVDVTYDKEFSSIIGWLSDEDKELVLKIVRILSKALYESDLKRRLEYE